MLWGRIQRWRISHGNELDPLLRGNSVEERDSVFCFAPAGHGEYFDARRNISLSYRHYNNACVSVPVCSLNCEGRKYSCPAQRWRHLLQYSERSAVLAGNGMVDDWTLAVTAHGFA